MNRRLFLQRFIFGFLGLALVALALPISALATTGVVTTTATIGGGSAKLVYITMGNGRTADVALAGGSVHKDIGAEALINSVTADGNSTVVAAVNGGFFNSYYKPSAQSFPGNCPRIYSTVVKDGRVVNGAGQANMLGVTWDGVPYIDNAKLGCTVLINGRIELAMWYVNNYDVNAKSISLFTGEFTLPVVTQKDSKVLTLRDGRVAAISPGGTYSVPAGAELLVYNAGAAADAQTWNQFPAIGDTAEVVSTGLSCQRTADLSAWQNMKTVVAGGRMLLQNTYDVTANDIYNAEFAGDSKQSNTGKAGRSFAAVMKDGRLLLGTATATFPQIATYLKSIGAVNAVSLDGGASSMLYTAAGFSTSAGRKLASAFVIVDEKVREEKPDAPVLMPDEGSETGLGAHEPSAWAVAPIAQGKELELIPAWLQGNYRSNITRSEFCTLIVKLIEEKTGKVIDAVRLKQGKPMAEAFSDTDNWFVLECASFGIVNGENGRFRPSDFLTRQEAAAILWRTATVLGATDPGPGKIFTDAAQIEAWATLPVSNVTAIGIMNGDGTSFKPKGTFTREEAFITMVNCFNKL